MGLIVFGTAIWLKTVRTTLVEIPSNLHAETISKDFAADYSTYYPISIHFSRGTPPAVALYALGAKGLKLDCSATPPVLRFSWEFTQEGEPISSGTTANEELKYKNDGGLIVGPFGGLLAEKKQNYTVVIKLDEDATAMQIPPPSIRIEMASFKHTDFFIVGSLLDVLGVALCVTGLMILLYV